MTLLPIEVHPDAAAEAGTAVQWYRERNEAAANAFLAELDRAMKMIAERPQMWPEYVGGTRRFLLRHFPFSVVYRRRSENIQVIAIAHGRRKPGYWKNRIA